jgi:hypothetical protein
MTAAAHDAAAVCFSVPVTALEQRVAAVAALAPLADLSADQLAELDELMAGADALEDLPGKWQAAVLEAELRAAGESPGGGHGHCCH